MFDFFLVVFYYCFYVVGWFLCLCWKLLCWVLLIFVLLWVLVVVVWGVLYWIIFLYVNDWCFWLEWEVLRVLGVEMCIGCLNVDLGGWMLGLEFVDVCLFDIVGCFVLWLLRVIVVLLV